MRVFFGPNMSMSQWRLLHPDSMKKILCTLILHRNEYPNFANKNVHLNVVEVGQIIDKKIEVPYSTVKQEICTLILQIDLNF